MESGFGELASILEERNQDAIDEIIDAPSVAYLPAGTDVQVFVNQTMRF